MRRTCRRRSVRQRKDSFGPNETPTLLPIFLILTLILDLFLRKGLLQKISQGASQPCNAIHHALKVKTVNSGEGAVKRRNPRGGKRAKPPSQPSHPSQHLHRVLFKGGIPRDKDPCRSSSSGARPYDIPSAPNKTYNRTATSSDTRWASKLGNQKSQSFVRLRMRARTYARLV